VCMVAKEDPLMLKLILDIEEASRAS